MLTSLSQRERRRGLCPRSTRLQNGGVANGAGAGESDPTQTRVWESSWLSKRRGPQAGLRNGHDFDSESHSHSGSQRGTQAQVPAWQSVQGEQNPRGW